MFVKVILSIENLGSFLSFEDLNADCLLSLASHNSTILALIPHRSRVSDILPDVFTPALLLLLRRLVNLISTTVVDQRG